MEDKKSLLTVGLVASIVILLTIITAILRFGGFDILTRRYEPISINATENLVLQYKGLEGDGWIVVKSNDIEYDEVDEERINELLETFDYDISKILGCSNGDEIHVTVTYNKKKAEALKITVTDLEKDFVVSGLVGETRTEETRTETLFDGTAYMEYEVTYEIIDGVEIPKDWYLSDQEKANYVRYMKCIDGNPDGWIEVCHYEAKN